MNFDQYQAAALRTAKRYPEKYSNEDAEARADKGGLSASES